MKDERLQQNDQNMEKPPDQAGRDLSEPSAHTPKRAELKSETTQKGDQEEDQLAGVHIAEESHPQRHEFGGVLDDVQQEVERPKSGMLAKRRRKQFNHEARDALDLDAVVEEQEEDAEGDAEVPLRSAVGSGRR